MIVPYRVDFRQLQSSIPMILAGGALPLATRLRWRRIVSSLTGIPKRRISLSAGRPPAAWPKWLAIWAARKVRRA